MIRSLLIIVVCCTNLFAPGVFAQGNAVSQLGSNSQGTSVSQSAPKKLMVGFGDSDIRYGVDTILQSIPEQRWSVAAWRGERVHVQVLVQSGKTNGGLKLRFSDLIRTGQSNISSENFRFGMVQPVMTDEYAGGCGAPLPEAKDSSLARDRIDYESGLDKLNGKLQVVWVSLDVPLGAEPGIYTGTVKVMKQKLRISLEVMDGILPPASDWSFDLDLWQHPAAVARVHDVELWSDKHFDLLRPYFRMLAEAGQKNITASIVEEPWGHQTYDDYPSLIKWIKKTDGSWQFDYSLFDKYVQFVMDAGIDKRINCYSMIPWKMVVRYYDEASGKDSSVTTPIGSEAYVATWRPMLKDFTRHLKEKGWFSITSIAMDERPLKDMQQAINMLKEIDPSWKIALAGDYHAEIEKDLFDYCLASRWDFPEEVLRARIAAGKPSTYYTCCVEQYPNNFTFSPAAEQSWIGWYAAAKGFTGYLRWAYNSWPADPLRDSRFGSWPAGDTYQVYPGPQTSVRFEKLREGIQDFEKMRILRERWTREGKKGKIEMLDSILKRFKIEALATVPAASMLKEARRDLLKIQGP
ncbi:glycoside hydrolase domain-containing protein [Flavihumibacter sp. ZG627]|uniref:DUF4091 domain-containing protein n=1 Tax=Flavihumibacter sp. ZG627 TaxID=1463156 RepID=UPI0009E560F0|nr:glycoside hydrolase domain-containing protein [Flavihumibacter sp. ZG627]